MGLEQAQKTVCWGSGTVPGTGTKIVCWGTRKNLRTAQKLSLSRRSFLIIYDNIMTCANVWSILLFDAVVTSNKIIKISNFNFPIGHNTTDQNESRQKINRTNKALSYSYLFYERNASPILILTIKWCCFSQQHHKRCFEIIKVIINIKNTDVSDISFIFTFNLLLLNNFF